MLEPRRLAAGEAGAVMDAAMGVGIDEDALVAADQAGDGAGHRAEAEVVHGAGFGAAEPGELLLELEVERRGAGERAGAERGSGAVFVGDRAGGGDRFRMEGEAEIVVGRDLKHLPPPHPRMGRAVVDREDAREDIGELVEVVAGGAAHPLHEDVAFLEKVGHFPLASYF